MSTNVEYLGSMSIVGVGFVGVPPQLFDIRTIFDENRDDFADSENWKGAYCIIHN